MHRGLALGPGAAASPAVRYTATALALGVGLFGLLRVGWVEQHVLLPLTAAQGRLACALAGDPAAPIQVGLSCSAADVVALCAAAILAFPATLGRRLWGVGVGLAMIGAVNTARIGTLGRVADQRALFSLLHLYLWPGLLILAVTAYVVWWMRWASPRDRDGARHPKDRSPAIAFMAWAVPLVALYLFVAPRLLEAGLVETATRWVAAAGAFLLGALGVASSLDGQVLRIGSAAWVVTPECVMTPVLPLYLAAAVALSRGWGSRALALAAALPLFFTLAVGRLLVLALPVGLVGSPLAAVHAFRQLLLAAIAIAAAARWRAAAGPARQWLTAAGLGLAVALAAGWLGSALARPLVAALVAEVPDPQGALGLLPGFQLGLLVGLWVALRRRHAGRGLPIALGLLGLQLVFGLLLVGALWSREIALHTLAVRAWAVTAPLAIALLLDSRARRPAPPAPRAA